MAAGGGMRAALALIAVGLVMGVCLFSQRHHGPVVLENYQWKGYEPESNAFDDFDAGFSQGAWKTYEPPANVFNNLEGLAELDHKWKGYEKPENVYDHIPAKYPFDETKGGHEWKEWKGSTASEALEEPNVFDHGQGLAAIEIGEHSNNGEPYKPYEAEKNVFENLHTKGDDPEWGKTVDSLPDKNVFDDIKMPDY